MKGGFMVELLDTTALILYKLPNKNAFLFFVISVVPVL